MDISTNKKTQFEAQSTSNRSIKTFVQSALGIVEIKASFFMILFAAITFYAEPGFFDWDIKIVDTFYKAKAQETVSEIFKDAEVEPVDPPEVSLEVPIEDFYSFQYTSLGFYTKSLDFLEGLSREEAEEKIINLLPRNLRAKAKNYIKATLIICEKYQVDPLWVLSVMWTESHFRPFITSHVGASGLMQVMPGTRKYLYRDMKRNGHSLLVEQNDFDMQYYFNFDINSKHFKKYVRKLVNIELGVVYLKRLLKNFNYNHKYATVAYNMGPGWTQKRLRNNLPVGNDNLYLTKVMRAYKYLVRRI